MLILRQQCLGRLFYTQHCCDVLDQKLAGLGFASRGRQMQRSSAIIVQTIGSAPQARARPSRSSNVERSLAPEPPFGASGVYVSSELHDSRGMSNVFSSPRRRNTPPGRGARRRRSKARCHFHVCTARGGAAPLHPQGVRCSRQHLPSPPRSMARAVPYRPAVARQTPMPGARSTHASLIEPARVSSASKHRLHAQGACRLIPR